MQTHQQHFLQTAQPSFTGKFKRELCGFNCGDCLCACLLPPCFAYVTAQAAGEGLCSSLMQCLCWPFCICCLRGSVRQQRGIEGSCLGDLCASFLCPCCATENSPSDDLQKCENIKKTF